MAQWSLHDKEMGFCTSVGQIFRKRRLELKLTQDNVAYHLKINRCGYVQIENGNRAISLYECVLLCDILDISIARVLSIQQDTEEAWKKCV